MKSPEHPTSFAHRLRWARERAGLTQLELGVRAGLEPKVAAPRINQYENGVHEPKVETAQALADALGVPPAFLYTTDEELAELLLVWADLESAERRKLLKKAEAQLKSQNAKLGAGDVAKPTRKKTPKRSA